MSANPKSRIVILISADGEWQAVLNHFPAARLEKSPYGDWFQTAIPDLEPGTSPRPVIFFHGGWGKIASAGATQYAIDYWKPAALVNLGTCGGFEGQVEKGEILLVERTVVYDIIEQMGDFEAHIAHYATRIDLSWLQPPYPQPVRRTLLVSGDRDLLVDEIPELGRRYGAVAGDWESGAIAWVAARQGVRLLILRGVSDVVGAAGSAAYGDLTYFQHSAAVVMDRLLAALPLWLACL
ncbi:MAG TPA: hypothetical protein VN363_02390 [Anaerolineales bacterium]|nr:hypothetical protein [Anaerolineales bacterium]